MRTFKTVLAVLAIALAIVAIFGAGVGIYSIWAWNTPLTESLTGLLDGAGRVLTVADDGLARVDGGLTTARSATSTVEGAVLAAGDRIVSTDIAFSVLERTVGDTLFPAMVQASETARAVVDTVVAANDVLESANRLPLVEVPTITAELELAAGEVAAARQQVEAIRGEMQTMKEQAVARPVTAVTDRTEPLLGHIDAALSRTAAAREAITRGQEQMAARRESLPRTIDLWSVVLTLVLLWTIVGQIALILWGVEQLRGRRQGAVVGG